MNAIEYFDPDHSINPFIHEISPKIYWLHKDCEKNWKVFRVVFEVIERIEFEMYLGENFRAKNASTRALQKLALVIRRISSNFFKIIYEVWVSNWQTTYRGQLWRLLASPF